MSNLVLPVVDIGDEVQKDLDDGREELPGLGVGRRRILVHRVQRWKRKQITMWKHKCFMLGNDSCLTDQCLRTV